MAGPTGYSLQRYGDMITEAPRMGPYATALRQVVTDGSVVVDIGAGTGIFSMLACRAGAGHVHAVEPDDAIQVARSIAAANGLAEKITFHQALSTSVTLPKRADVIVSDLRGALPLFQHHIPAIIDARERLLAPGGHLIPQADEIWSAVVEEPRLYRPYAEPWLRNDYGLDMSAGHPLVVNTWCRASIEPEHLLVAPHRWATLDYRTIAHPDVAGAVSWTVERAGTGHGLALWFDATLAEGVGFSNAPGKPKLIYDHAFFPWQEPVALEVGDQVSAELRANLVGPDYIWRWQTRVQSAEGHESKAAFDQSTFMSRPIALDHLRKQKASHVPALDIEGEIERFLLVAMDGQASLEEIARRAAERFPEYFASREAALTRAGQLSARLSR